MIAGLSAPVPVSAAAESVADRFPEVEAYFPQADRFGAIGGTPPAAEVYRGRQLLGYVFLTSDLVRIPAYSGQPINVLVGLDTGGRITGLRVVEHSEPILLAGVTEAQLHAYIAQYRGKNVNRRIRIGGDPTMAGTVHVDTISGATITVMVANATIVNAARKLLAARPPLPRATETPTHRPGASQSPARRSSPPAAPVGESDSGAATAVSHVGTTPIWIDVWGQRHFQIAVLVTGLAALTLMIAFQDWLTRRRRLMFYLRTGFLIYTVVFIGWYGLAQLSVLNVLIFLRSLVHDFSWNSFLIEPLIFILWCFVAVMLLLLGRGVYCGWLCPFGALQELINKLARRLSVPQFELPEIVHERLWAVKYIILIVLFGLSLQSIDAAERLAEVEPFRTAITLRFQREWPFALYASLLLAASLFNQKFYCRYLCVLGAALSIPAKYRIFDWLHRRKECGSSCQICRDECGVRAIASTGRINPSECHYCLDCQINYWDVKTCPPLRDAKGRIVYRD